MTIRQRAKSETEEIRDHLTHVHAQRPVHKVVERLLENVDQPLEDINALVDALNKPTGWRWREQIIAAWALGFLPQHDKRRTVAITTLCSVVTGIYGAMGHPIDLRSIVAITIYDADHTYKIRKSASASPCRLKAVEGVNCLVHGTTESSQVGYVSIRALEQLLPFLSEADYGSVDKKAMSRLCQLLCNPGLCQTEY